MPRPFPKKISQIKPTLSNVATTSHFVVTFGGMSQGLMTYLKRKGINSRFAEDELALLCSSASLPGSTHAVTNIIGNYQGIAENMAHTRFFTRTSMEFYVDTDYKSLKFFEHWIEYMNSGSRIEGEAADQLAHGYYARMRYPVEYKCDETRIVKFERDYKNYTEYKYIGLFPITLNATQVSYQGSQLLKATVEFSYDRHIAGRSRSIDKFFDESQNDEASSARAQRSFAQTYRDKNLDGRDDINGFNKLPRDMTPPESRDAFSNLIADGRFLNGNGLIISEGIRASSGRIG